MTVSTFDEFRDAIVAHLERNGSSRNELAMSLDKQRVLRAHSVRCILSQAPSLRRRYASFNSILAIADAAGFTIQLSLKNETE